jgi:hypothetical protein
MAGLDAQDAQDGAVKALGGREVRDGDADMVEHPAEATVAGMLDVPHLRGITLGVWIEAASVLVAVAPRAFHDEDHFPRLTLPIRFENGRLMTGTYEGQPAPTLSYFYADERVDDQTVLNVWGYLGGNPPSQRCAQRPTEFSRRFVSKTDSTVGPRDIPARWPMEAVLPPGRPPASA